MPPVFSSLPDNFNFTFICVPVSECVMEMGATQHRNQLRAALRRALDDELEMLTARLGAHMSWTRKGYVKLVVLRYGYILKGWPADVPFVNLSLLPGGIAPLRKLYALWSEGILRFVLATPEMLALAVEDPLRVPPVERNPAAVPAAEGVVVSTLALHPGTLNVLGTHPTSTKASRRATHGERARRQRRDVKKARARPVTNPEGRPLRRAKLGVKSATCVLDGDGDAGALDRHFWTVDDPLGELRWV